MSSLEGDQGPIGLTGPAGSDGSNGAAGADGDVGPQGDTGATGDNGVNGLSAYEIAVNNGYGFPESVWLSSLEGSDGEQGLIGNTIWQQDSLNNISYNNGNVNIGSNAIDSSAVFTISSQTQGVMLPSMSETERDAIVSPTMGLLIFQNNGASGFYYYNGTQWAMIGGGSGEFDPTLIYTTDGF